MKQGSVDTNAASGKIFSKYKFTDVIFTTRKTFNFNKTFKVRIKLGEFAQVDVPACRKMEVRRE